MHNCVVFLHSRGAWLTCDIWWTTAKESLLCTPTQHKFCPCDALSSNNKVLRWNEWLMKVRSHDHCYFWLRLTQIDSIGPGPKGTELHDSNYWPLQLCCYKRYVTLTKCFVGSMGVWHPLTATALLRAILAWLLPSIYFLLCVIVTFPLSHWAA